MPPRRPSSIPWSPPRIWPGIRGSVQRPCRMTDCRSSWNNTTALDTDAIMKSSQTAIRRRYGPVDCAVRELGLPHHHRSHHCKNHPLCAKLCGWRRYLLARSASLGRRALCDNAPHARWTFSWMYSSWLQRPQPRAWIWRRRIYCCWRCDLFQ